MNNYCEVFKTGVHKDANGNERVWTVDDLDKIVSSFEESNQSAPIVVGHPKTNNPAFGWVDKLKRVGEKLYASFKEVAPEFAEWVNTGRYKNRSIALYPDLKLRHVGFLGAQQPAIKGLEEFQFEEDENLLLFEFSEFEDYKFEQISDIFQRLRDFLIDKFDLETADKIISTWKIEDLKAVMDKEPAEIQAYCEEMINTRKEHKLKTEGNEDKQPQKKDEELNFNEQLEAKDTELQKARTELEAERAKARKVDFEQFAEKAIADGNITPAQKSFVMDFCEVCHNTGEFEFAEGEEKSALENFKGFVTGVKQIEFGEMSNEDNAGVTTLDFADPDAISTAIIEYKEAEAKKGNIVTEVEAMNALKAKQTK